MAFYCFDIMSQMYWINPQIIFFAFHKWESKHFSEIYFTVKIVTVDFAS